MSSQQPLPSSSNNNLPPFDWSLPGRNLSGSLPPPLMVMPHTDDPRLPSTMERILNCRDNQHEEESDDDNTISQNGLSRKEGKTGFPLPASPIPDTPKSNSNHDSYSDDGKDDISNVENEYVQEDIPTKPGDGHYSHFSKIVENFKFDQNNDENNEFYYNKYGKKIAGSKIVLPRDKTNIDNDDKETINYEKKKNNIDDDEQKKNIAEDSKLLVHLKATRNTVPVSRHWCAKRKYLQGKRGIEKPPFQLPDFIRRTGTMEMREASQEKEQNKTLKQKMRENVRPKLGKIGIDYQKLYDAFFRRQTKPRMTIHGDLYYEGKENETRFKDKKPGVLSEELRLALGIPVGPTVDKYPPPWLIAMQRYGSPPSYPNLKIAGLNGPIPESYQFGYHSGGWVKPPVDKH